VETGRSKGECCRRKAILLSLSYMSWSQTTAEGHHSRSRKVVGPPLPAERVDCGNVQFPNIVAFGLFCVYIMCIVKLTIGNVAHPLY
jgi:hypothetical protein